MSESQKKLINLLKFFAISASQGVNYDFCQNKTNHYVLRDERDRLRNVACKIVDSLVSQGSLKRDCSVQKLTITAEGKSRLRRLICHEEIYAAQHRDLESIEIKNEAGISEVLLANMRESPLAWLYSRKDGNGKRLINEFQLQAGERLRSDYERAHLRQRISANWEAALSGGKRGAAKGGQDIHDATLDARKRVNHALDAVGNDMGSILVDICCHLKKLTQIEKEKQWPQRSAKVVLTIALNQLAQHYGLSTCSGPKKNKLRAWGDGDHRPDLYG